MPKVNSIVDQIPWAEKNVASGKAIMVPPALEGLTSPDEKIRNRSYWQLDNEVVLQSDLYESAYFVIPILIDRLSERVEFGRERIYDLLYEIANGDAPSSVTIRDDGKILSLKNACDVELRKGLMVYLRDLWDKDSIVKRKAEELVDVLDENETRDGIEMREKLNGLWETSVPKNQELVRFSVRRLDGLRDPKGAKLMLFACSPSTGTALTIAQISRGTNVRKNLCWVESLGRIGDPRAMIILRFNVESEHELPIVFSFIEDWLFKHQVKTTEPINYDASTAWCDSAFTFGPLLAA